MNNTDSQLLLFNDSPVSLKEAPVIKKEPRKSTPPNIEPSWLKVLHEEFNKPYMADLREFLRNEKNNHTIYPRFSETFKAFSYTPYNKVKVTILGQDPYHGKNQAHGLCFSVRKEVPIPPSLVNIYKELHADLNIPIPQHGCLTSWAKQGVFLLNTVLSVRANEAHSHAGKGWEYFTNKVISELSNREESIVFILWGRPAQKKTPLIDQKKHLVLKAAHPSPFSAYNGFFGCRHFSQINEHLAKQGQKPIDWKITES